MKTITYTTTCAHTGLTHRFKVENVSRVEDKPYPPGGTLRYCYNDKGQAICGPMVSEIIQWDEEEQ